MDHFSGTDEAHPLLRMAAAVSGLVKGIQDVDPIFMTPEDRAAAMAELDKLEDQLRLVKLRVVRASGDLAADAGFKTVGAWRSRVHRRGHGEAAADDRLAEALDERWTATGVAIREGRLSMEQAGVITKALDDLADALEEERKATLAGDTSSADEERAEKWIADVLVRAEAYLIEQAADHPPIELRRLAEGVLEVVAPEHADELLGRALERAERRAREKSRLRLKRCGDGTTRLSARIPDAAAHQLRTYLGSLTSPRVTYPGATTSNHASAPAPGDTCGSSGEVPAGGMFGDPGPQPTVVDPWLDPETGRRIPQEYRHGQAFVALLERISAHHLPQHGGLGANVVVTIDYQSLRDGVGHGTIGDPDGEGVDLPAGEVRRLACASGILPAVLGSDSVVLDLGWSSRFFSMGQRKAHAITHPTCEAVGCAVPAAWCESHHKRDPWAAGGTTNLADLSFLCPWHHHRAHDPAYRTDWLSGGGVRFHRRR